MTENLFTEIRTFQATQDLKVAALSRSVAEIEAELRRPSSGPIYGGIGRHENKTLADIVIGSDGFKSLCRAGKGTDRWLLDRSFFPAELKTTILASGQAAGVMPSQRSPAIVPPGVEDFRVRSLIPRLACTSAAIEYLRESVFSNAASPQVEGSAKAESALTFTLESMPIRTIAHWIPASKQVLDDIPQLRGYIDMRLLDGLMDAEDAELLTGDGTGQHLSGLITEATAYDTVLNVSGDTKLDKLNHAVGQVEAAKLRPTGIVLNPADWRAMELLKDGSTANTGVYILGGPRASSRKILWGLPTATTTALPKGKFLVADFRLVALFDREDARIEVSTEHSDFFTKNLVAIRAEERVSLVVFRSDALVYGSF